MNRYDPLDWVHSWDDFEMMMYAVADGDDTGIFMQVSRREMQYGAEVWETVYDRKLTDEFRQTEEKLDSDPWHEAVLRHYLNTHPELVSDEKAFLSEWLREHSK